MQRYNKYINNKKSSNNFSKLILLSIGVLLSTSAFSQQVTVMIDEGQITIKEAFNAIERQTNYKFAFGNDDLDLQKKVELPRTRSSVTTILVHLLKDTGYSYRFYGNNIVIVKIAHSQISDPISTPVPTLRSISGTVVDNVTNGALAKARVRVIGSTAVITDTTGGFKFEAIPTGFQTIQVVSQGYITAERGIIVDGDSDNDFVLRLQPTIPPQTKSVDTIVNLKPVTTLDNIDDTVAQNVESLSSDSFESIVSSNNTLILNIDHSPHDRQPYDSERVSSSKIGIKSNLLYLATMSANVSLEYALGLKWSTELTAGFNMFEYGGNTSLNHYLVEPEVRYWICRPFEGTFFGLHAIYADFSVGELPINGNIIKTHTFEGSLFGGGITFGRHWALGSRWGLEAALGVGYLRVRYDEIIVNQDCKTCLRSESRNYFGPTKAALSLVYILK